MTQDERFLKSIHIVPDLAPVGKRTRETSLEWIGTPTPTTEPKSAPESTIYEQLLADLKLRQIDCGSGPGLTTDFTAADAAAYVSSRDDAHSFSVTLSYAEWVAVVAAIESTVAKMDIRRPEAAEVATRLYQAYIRMGLCFEDVTEEFIRIDYAAERRALEALQHAILHDDTDGDTLAWIERRLEELKHAG